MSALVSYGMGSSDESEHSDNEGSTLPPACLPRLTTESKHTVKNSCKASDSTGPSIQKSCGSNSNNSDVQVGGNSSTGAGSSGGDDSVPRKKSLFSSLPPPKCHETLSFEESRPADKTPATRKERNPTGMSQGLLNLPLPKKKQTVQITVPSIPDPDSDDDEGPDEKKLKTMKGSGLFSMLPKPKTASRKEANRILLPYTLTKKPPTKPTNALPTNTPPQALTSPGETHLSSSALVSGYHSDDDESSGGGNFFTLGRDDESIDMTVATSPRPQIHPISGTFSEWQSTRDRETSLQRGLVSDSNTELLRTGGDAGTGLGTPPHLKVHNVTPAAQDRPLVFNSSKSPGFVPQIFPHAGGALAFSQSPHSSSSYAFPGDSSLPYRAPAVGEGGEKPSGVQYSNQPYEAGQDWTGPEPGMQATSEQQFLQDERFAKMVGKNNRGREDIQIIDINADDQIGPTSGLQQMVKSMTEEKEYRGKLKKEQLPTSQQKRKHQITYLARQAKERELELKNQWADNRMTRKQTQAKYGF